jgi:hypothetical protein
MRLQFDSPAEESMKLANTEFQVFRNIKISSNQDRNDWLRKGH